MSDTPATLISLDDIARPAAEDGPSPVPPILKAPVAKGSASKPAAKKPAVAAKAVPVQAAPVEPQPQLQSQPQPEAQPQPHVVTEQAAEPATRSTKESKMVETIQMITDKTKSAFAEANERAKAQMEKNAQSFQEFGAFNKGNLEAIVESSKIAATGMQKLGQDAAVYAKSSYENATSAFKSMTTVKSPTELFKLQSDFARASFDAFVAEASRSTEAALKLAGEIAQPISNRVALAAEKIKVAA